MFAKIACMLNRHRPVRPEARWTGSHYESRCRDCGKPVRRLGKGRWREVPRDAP